MTPAEADRFLTDGASLWNAVQSCACEDNSYCVEDMKVLNHAVSEANQTICFLFCTSHTIPIRMYRSVAVVYLEREISRSATVKYTYHNC